MTGDDQERLITVPVQAREEIGKLGFYLEQAVWRLREVDAHVRGSSERMPNVLNELRTINSMTEAATVRVLEETEALVDDGRQAVELLGNAERAVAVGASAPATQCLSEARVLVAGATDRALAIMSALEFQDLTAQRVQRLFGVLDEVIRRLAKIHRLVALGQDSNADAERPAPSEEPTPPGKSGQALADEVMEGFA